MPKPTTRLLLLLTFLLCGRSLFAANDGLETFDKHYKGSIGDSKIELFLINRFSSLGGYYNYDDYPDQSIQLTGVKRKNNIFLNEDAGETVSSDGETTFTAERFTGTFINDSTIVGTWSNGKKKLSFKLSEIKQKINVPENPKFNDLVQFNGLDPWESKFFEKPVVQSHMKNLLKLEYAKYLDFLKGSGFDSGFVGKDDLLVEDFLYLNIGCVNQSILVVDTRTRAFYLCWIKENEAQPFLYSERQDAAIPYLVLQYFVDSLNDRWGHLYKFARAGNRITSRRVN